MIPITVMFEPANYISVSALVFAYIVIVSGWIGYARSVSVKPHKDTALGALRFVVDLVILFEYFYLLRTSQTGPISDFPLVMVVIFMTYVLSDRIKYYEHTPRQRVWIQHRSKITLGFLAIVLLTGALYNDGMFVAVASEHAHTLSIAVFAILVILHRVAKWKLTPRRPRRSRS